MKPFHADLNSLYDSGILKHHNGSVGEYIEYRLLGNLPNGKRGADHPEFELKNTRFGTQMTLADLSDDYLCETFRETHIYDKCKNVVYVPWDVINGEKVFCGFYHIKESSWQTFMNELETDWQLIKDYIDDNGLECLKTKASSNFVKETKHLQLFRCRDRISTKTGRLRKPALRIKIRWSLMKSLIENVE